MFDPRPAADKRKKATPSKETNESRKKESPIKSLRSQAAPPSPDAISPTDSSSPVRRKSSSHLGRQGRRRGGGEKKRKKKTAELVIDLDGEKQKKDEAVAVVDLAGDFSFDGGACAEEDEDPARTFDLKVLWEDRLQRITVHEVGLSLELTFGQSGLYRNEDKY